MKKGICLLLALLLLLTGCGSSSMKSDTVAETWAASYDSGYGEDALETNGSESSLDNLPQGRKFIIRMDITAEAQELEPALQTVTDRLTALGGYVEDQYIYNGSLYSGRRYRNADLTLRVPADKLSELIAAVEETGNVVSSSRSTEDVTLQYVDTESRIAALKTEQTRLLERMEQAETMSDLLEIESRLTEVRGELERYASQLKVLDNQIDYATVNLSLSEVTEYTPVVEKSRLEKIRDGFVSSVKGVGNLILDFISFVLMNIPYILLFGLILWGILALVKRHRRKHPKKPKAEPKKED